VLLLPGLVNAQLSFENQPHAGHGLTAIQGIMISADVNNDGNEDIFASGYTNILNETYDGAILYLGNGNGGFTPAPNQPFLSHQIVTNAEFVHYNSDSHIDLVVVYIDVNNNNKVFISILLNDGSGSLVPTYTFEVDGGAINANLKVADLDNDGDMDILVSIVYGTTSFETVIYRNDNNVFIKLTTTISPFNGAVVIFDYDQDGKKDILVSGPTGSGIITKLYRNLGAMNFQEITAPFPGLQFPAIAVGNIDNNPGGFESVVIFGVDTSGNEILHVYLNNNGVFTLHQSLPGTQQGEIQLGDFNNNGSLDMFVIGGMAMNSSARAFENIDGEFSLKRTFQPGLAAATAVLVDFNNDDKLDIIYSGANNALGVEIYAYKNTTQTMSIDDFTKDSVIIYPNPTRGQLNIQLPNSVEVTGIFVTDITGRVITLPAGNLVDISNLSSGMYFVTVQSNDLQVTKKVIKSK
jgi:hypothetical protein